jgi:catalase
VPESQPEKGTRDFGRDGEGPEKSGRYGLPILLAGRNLPWLVAIGVVIAGVAIVFAYTAGWLSPGRLTQGRVIDRFQQVNGLHPGFRRNHAKGVCFTGWFDSDGTGQRLSSAVVFRPGRTPVFGRFALASGQPYQADGPAVVRSLAMNFALRDGEIWRTGMINIPVFPVRDVQAFYDQLAASAPDPTTGKPDPARMKAFLAAHPETASAIGLIKAQSFSSGFADASYNGLNAFRFVSAAGVSTPVRWSLVAEDPFRPDTPSAAETGDTNYLFDDLVARVRKGQVRWRLAAVVGQPGDSTKDPTVPWPSGREQVQLGVLTVDQLQDEAHGSCRDVTFDPLILPSGIVASDDPILSARSATYSTSFTRRAGEPKSPSAVRFPSGVEGGR